MRRFYEDWVVPSNMALVLAGDLDPDAAVKLAEEHFGHFEDRATPPRANPALFPELVGESVTELRHHGSPAVHVAWRTVAFDHPDRPALRMVDMLLDNGKTGLIDTELNAVKRVRGAGAFPRLYRDGGAQVVWARPLAGQSIEDARGLLLEQIERLRSGDISSDLLDSIFLHWRLGELAARESNKARAGWMTAAFVRRQSWAEQRAELERHQDVTVADVARVARRYLGDDRAVVVRRTGPPAHTPLPVPVVTARTIETTAHSAFFDSVIGSEVRPLVPQSLAEGQDWEVARTAAGTVYANRNPHSDLCQLSWVWEQGYEGHRGRSYALRLLSLAGDALRSRVEFDRWLHEKGVRIGARCGRHETHLSLAGPSAAVLSVLDAVWARWHTPRVDPEVAQAYLQDAIQRRQVDKGTKKTLVGAARGFALYGEDSSALAHSPGDDELLGLLDLNAEGEPRFYERLRPLLGMSRDLIYTGASSLSTLTEVLAPAASVSGPPPERAPIRKARVEEPLVVMVHHASAQASVTVYRSSGPHTLDRLGPGSLYGRWLGGSAGVCFQELREARALAYSTSGGLSFGAMPGDDDILWAQAATHPDKAVLAASLLVEILDRPLEDSGRFERSRAELVQALRTERILARSIPSTARWWDQRGFEEDPRARRLDRIQALEQREVEAFRQSLCPGPPVLVIVGDLEVVNVRQFDALGKVVRMLPEDLFCY